MALTSLSATMKAIFNYSIAKSKANKTSARATDDTDALNTAKSLALTFGTGANQADQVYQDRRTLAASASEDLNISGGAHGGAVALTNPLGEAISFTKIKGILIVNESLVGEMRVGGEATNAFTALFADNSDELKVRPDGFFAVGVKEATAYAVAANEVLQITNLDGSNSLTYLIIIFGIE